MRKKNACKITLTEPQREMRKNCSQKISLTEPQLWEPLTVNVMRFVCLFGFLTSSSTTRLYRGRAPRQERLTILRAATHETELGDHDFCLSRSHYTDTDPTCRERAATAGIEPGTSSPGVARSTAELPRPPRHAQCTLSFLRTSGVLNGNKLAWGMPFLHRCYFLLEVAR